MEEKKNHLDPWDPDFYETGSTKPPKSHGSAVAVALVCLIFIGGMITVFSYFRFCFPKRSTASVEKNGVLFQISEQNTTDAPSVDPTVNSVGTNPTLSFHLEDSPLSVENIPQEGGLSLQEVYQKNIDSIVSIVSSSNVSVSTGTGVIFSADGYVVTNEHVIGSGESISVILNNGSNLNATVIGSDIVTDLAVLKITAENLQAASFGDSDALRVGDAVSAIGNPLGEELRGTMTNGIISAINRDISVSGRTMTLIQTNAALNSGNSGGALLNCYGQVVGITALKIGDNVNSAGVEGLGFAIPSTTVKEIVDQLVSLGYVAGRPSLGISGESVSLFYQSYYRLPAGLYITSVSAGSVADDAGISPGDILLSIGETRVTDVNSLNSALFNYQAGDAVDLIIYRAGHQYRVPVTLDQAT